MAKTRQVQEHKKLGTSRVKKALPPMVSSACRVFADLSPKWQGCLLEAMNPCLYNNFRLAQLSQSAINSLLATALHRKTTKDAVLPSLDTMELMVACQMEYKRLHPQLQHYDAYVPAWAQDQRSARCNLAIPNDKAMESNDHGGEKRGMARHEFIVFLDGF